MLGDETLDPRNLTFSQAQGYEDLPSLLALEQLSSDARLEIWNLLYHHADRSSQSNPIGTRVLTSGWLSVAKTLHVDFLKIPLDDFRPLTRSFVDHYREYVLDILPFNRVFDLIQMIMRHDNCPHEFISAVEGIFERCRLAYFVDTNGPATILPMSTRQEGEAVREAIDIFHTAGLTGPVAHLRQAGQLINQGDWSGSIRESIHAVESIARNLTPDEATAFAPALRSLEKIHPIHPALKHAFIRLYGYTSDEEGIRHPLINSADSPAGRDEAVFMLSACASFTSYLWRVTQGSKNT